MSQRITIYTHPGCPGGDRALNFFRRVGVCVRVADIAQSAEALVEFQSLHCIGTPAIVIDGECFEGFDEDVIRARLSDGDQAGPEVRHG